jgi:lysophospholipase L1-like esterase
VYEWFSEEVAILVKCREENPPPLGVTAFYGSSSIRLWESLPEDFPDMTFINLGFGGSTLGSCVFYFDALVPPCQPGAMVCYVGENDIGDGRSPDQIMTDFNLLHGKVAALPGDIPFVYLSIKPSPNRWSFVDRIKEVNGRIAGEIAKRPQSHFIDVYTPMLNDNGRPRRELWAEDGIHMTRDGYRVWWQIISVHRRDIGF